MLAKVQQQLWEKGKMKFYRNTGSHKSAVSASGKTEAKQQAPNHTWSKERQKRYYCKANSLCFYCNEHFDAAHLAKCTKRPRAQVNALALNDMDVQLTEEMVKQLELEDALAAEFCSLSLNAISGTDTGEALKLRALVQNKVMLILVDSGSSHSFVSSNLLSKCGILPQAGKPQLVKVANGETMITDKVVPKFTWWIQGQTMTADMRVLDLTTYDAILGYDWLKLHRPMQCHWEKRHIQFESEGKMIELQGLMPPPLQLGEVSVEKVLQWDKGNELAALAVVEMVPPEGPPEVPPAVQTLLEKYKDVFDHPTVLPPSRLQDHHIPLFPNTAPVNSMHYRYSPLQKNEIER